MNHTNSDIAVINRGNVDSYESTKNIKISLKPLVTLATEVVNIYKYSPEMASPEHLCDVRITPTGIFEFELDNPDNDTDYIMYYS